MKNLKAYLSLLVLVLLLSPLVWSQDIQPLQENINNNLNTTLPNELKTNESTSNDLNLNLEKLESSLNEQQQTQQMYEETSTELSQLLQTQKLDLLSLQMQWQAMEMELAHLSSNTTELQSLLQNSKITIENLENNLYIAEDRILDAEQGAIALLDENTELYEYAKEVLEDIQKMQAKQKRTSIVNFTSGILIGGGTVFALAQDYNTFNADRALIGGGIAVGTGAIWAIGKYVFDAW